MKRYDPIKEIKEKKIIKNIWLTKANSIIFMVLAYALIFLSFIRPFTMTQELIVLNMAMNSIIGSLILWAVAKWITK